VPTVRKARSVSAIRQGTGGLLLAFRSTNGELVTFRATGAEPLSLGAVRHLRLATFDGSGRLVHPDVARVPRGWAPARRFLAITPYPGGDVARELPSVYASGDPSEWVAPNGVKNPIVKPWKGYLSDPDLVFEPQRKELWMYYRQVDTKNRIYLVRSHDGIKWGSPVSVVDGANQTIISPTVVRKSATDWLMWSINGGPRGCSDDHASVELRRSKDGISWSAPTPIDLKNGDLMPWHIDVEWIPELAQYWALYPAKSAGSCATREIFLATSIDGVQWTTYPTPVLRSGELNELRDIVYRSTLTYDADLDEVRFWFSGANALDDHSFNWRTVFQRRKREDVFARVSSSLVQMRAHLNAIPQLIDPP